MMLDLILSMNDAGFDSVKEWCWIEFCQWQMTDRDLYFKVSQVFISVILSQQWGLGVLQMIFYMYI